MPRNKRRLATLLIIGLILVVGLNALFGTGRETIYTITTSGSTTVFPLSQEWSSYFHHQYPNYVVNPTTGGSGLGQSQVAAGLVHIGASSSYPKQMYRDQYPNIKIIPVAADALGIVVNPQVNGSVFRMDCDMAVAVFERYVTTWDEFETVFNVKVQATGDINVYVRSDASGTTATFTKWLETADENNNANGADFEWTLGDEESISWESGVFAVDGNPGVAEGVMSDPNGIGYVGLEFMEGLTPVSLLNPTTQEWVAPSVDNALNAMPENFTDAGQNLMNANNTNAYPIARLLFYLVNPDYLPDYVIFYLHWALTDGQAYVTNVGYVPLTGSSAQQYSLDLVASLHPNG